MKIFANDEESRTGKWCPVVVNVSIYLLMSCPILKHHFHFHSVWCCFSMYEDTKLHNVISNLKQFLALYTDIIF